MIEEDDLEEKQTTKTLVFCGCFAGAVQWLKMFAAKTHWSFIYGVVTVYGISQGLGGAMSRVGMDYYFKDVQKIQPSEAQVYAGVTWIPWIVKPLWGLLTDVLPICGYRRRPYFIFAGVLGMIPMGLLWVCKKLHLVFAVLALTIGSAGEAIADVTIDACVAQNSNIHPFLAPDFQSLCALCSSIGALAGYFVSGILVHLIGPKGVFGLLTIPSGLVLLVGVVLQEPRIPNCLYRQVNKRFVDVGKTMWATLKCPDIWRPSLYMYLSFALSLNIHEGMFFWFTDSEVGPSFSQEYIGYISSIGSIGSLIGALLYQYFLKNYPFRDLLFWTQLFFGLSGMLDLALVLRLNLKLGIPDYVFAVLDLIVFHLIARLKWMPLLVLSANLCPAGIEGTFFALLMSIDNAGFLSSTWLGGVLLQALRVTRTGFGHLWLAILIRNVLRIVPLGILFLVPRTYLKSSSSSMVGATQSLGSESEAPVESFGGGNVELVGLINNVDEHLGF